MLTDSSANFSGKAVKIWKTLVEIAARLIEAPEGAATRRRRRRFPHQMLSHLPRFDFHGLEFIGGPEGSAAFALSPSTINDSLRQAMRLSGGDGARFSARDRRKS